MSQTLYHYYERELTFIRQFAQEFARQYPAAAGRLLLEPNRSTDPHVERLIESFALLTGRIQHKIDDEFPELTTALLGVLYPHYLAPIPSMAIVQFELDAARARSPEGFAIDRHSRAEHPAGGRPALPVSHRLSGAALADPGGGREAGPSAVPARDEPAARDRGGPADPARDARAVRSSPSWPSTSCGFYLEGGERDGRAALRPAVQPRARGRLPRSRRGREPAAGEPPARTSASPRSASSAKTACSPIRPSRSSAIACSSEFFAFPYKFHFVDLRGLRRACRAGYQKQLEIVLFLDRSWPKLEQDVTAETFRLGCTPVINLFEQTAEPIPLTKARNEYRVVPDVAYPDGMEVYSVDQVTSVDPIAGETTEYLPFYSLRHGTTLEGAGISGTPCAGRRPARTTGGPRSISTW